MSRDSSLTFSPRSTLSTVETDTRAKSASVDTFQFFRLRDHLMTKATTSVGGGVGISVLRSGVCAISCLIASGYSTPFFRAATSGMSPNFHGGDQKDGGQRRQKNAVRHNTQQHSADEGSND